MEKTKSKYLNDEEQDEFLSKFTIREIETLDPFKLKLGLCDISNNTCCEAVSDIGSIVLECVKYDIPGFQLMNNDVFKQIKYDKFNVEWVHADGFCLGVELLVKNSDLFEKHILNHVR